MIGKKDKSFDFILTGDDMIFPYINWSILGGDGADYPGIDLCGDGSEDNIQEWFIPTWENTKLIFNVA